MDKYELVLVADANLSQQEKESLWKECSETIAKSDGKILNSQVWLDKYKMSFRIKKCLEGTYYMINFESLRSAVAKMRQLFRLNEKILRFLIIRVE